MRIPVKWGTDSGGCGPASESQTQGKIIIDQVDHFSQEKCVWEEITTSFRFHHSLSDCRVGIVDSGEVVRDSGDVGHRSGELVHGNGAPISAAQRVRNYPVLATGVQADRLWTERAASSFPTLLPVALPLQGR